MVISHKTEAMRLINIELLFKATIDFQVNGSENEENIQA